MERERESVNHPASGYMREMAHVNGVEGFRAMPKRGCHGACHHISPRHPERHIRAYAGRTRSTSWRRSWRGPAASACCAAVPLKVEKWPGKRQRGQLEALPSCRVRGQGAIRRPPRVCQRSHAIVAVILDVEDRSRVLDPVVLRVWHVGYASVVGWWTAGVPCFACANRASDPIRHRIAPCAQIIISATHIPVRLAIPDTHPAIGVIIVAECSCVIG